LKILICTPEYPPYSSGIGNVVYNIVNQFDKKNIDYKICSPVGPDFKIGNPKIMGKTGILGLIYFRYLITKRFKENDFDLIWIHGNIVTNKNLFKNVLITLHSTYRGFKLQKISPRIYYYVVSKIEEYILKKIDGPNCKFTGVSPEVCEELNNIGINSNKIRYISNGANTELFKPSTNNQILRKKFNLSKDDLIILSVGRLVEEKRPIELIEIFSFIEKNIENVTLAIAGDGKLLNEMKRMVKNKNLKNVKFLGQINYEKDIPDLYSCSDYFIMTSKYEGQPLTLLEAMSSGLKCIVSQIHSLSLIVDEADCGITINVQNTENTAKDIINYIKSDNKNHSKNARNFAVENYDWKKIADEYLEEIKKFD
jgi:1,2-diacylglycerol 3-alpha-glucosyltransferase